MLKQMIDFNKYTFESAYNGMAMLEGQAEQMAKMMLDQAAWLPEEGKKAIAGWVDAYKKGREDFKKRVDESFARVEGFLQKSK